LHEPTYVSGTWTPAHLWYLIYLFVFSLVALPLFLLLRRDAARGALASMARFFERPGALLLLAVPMVLASSVDLLEDKNPIYYFVCFVTGYWMMTASEYQNAVRRSLPVVLVIGIAFEVLRRIWRPELVEWSPLWMLHGSMSVLNRWAWVLVWLGLGARWLMYSGRALAYLAETSYAFYVLHLPVNTLVAWGLIQLSLPVAAKYLLIVAITVGLTFAGVEALRYIPGIGKMFGLKKPQSVAQPQQTPA